MNEVDEITMLEGDVCIPVLQKLHYDPEFCDCFTTFGREEDWLNYEDDSLQIVFERMCIQTKGKRVVGLRDYSVIPEVIYDKRENQQ